MSCVCEKKDVTRVTRGDSCATSRRELPACLDGLAGATAVLKGCSVAIIRCVGVATLGAAKRSNSAFAASLLRRRPGTRPLSMNPEDVTAPDITFRPIGPFPELRVASEKITLHSLTKPAAVATEPRVPTVIHMYDAG